MEYGWSFFQTSLQVSERLEKERMKAMATAVRTGYGANAKQWRQFINGT